MPYRDRSERRHERRRDDVREKPEDKSKRDKGKVDEVKKDTREARKDDRARPMKHSKTSRNRSRSRDNESEEEESRVERTDRFKSERFPEDRSVLITSSRRNDREFRGNRVGRPRDGRRPGGRRERRYSYQDEDHDMNKVTERFTNPTYCPKDNRYFLHDDREMTNTRRRNMPRSRSPLKWEHDLFKDESKEQEEMPVIDNEDDNMKWRSVVQVPMGSTGFGPQYDDFYHQYQRQQDGRWMHDKYFEMERATAAATR